MKAARQNVEISLTWHTLPASGAPAPRYSHAAVWTGNDMIVSGGYDGTNYFGTGARFSPIGNTWTPLDFTDAPVGRFTHSAVWTGSKMLIWSDFRAVSIIV